MTIRVRSFHPLHLIKDETMKILNRAGIESFEQLCDTSRLKLRTIGLSKDEVDYLYRLLKSKKLSFEWEEEQEMEILNNLDDFQSKASLFHYYAAHAPETIPVWFCHKKSGRPERPKYGYEITNNEKVANFIDSWISDPCLDLNKQYHDLFGNNDDVFSVKGIEKLSDEWQQYWKDIEQWKLKDQASRYFQWRKYYANVMANGLLLEDGLPGGIEALKEKERAEKMRAILDFLNEDIRDAASRF